MKEPFDKKIAIQQMLEGYSVVQSSEITKEQYVGEFCFFTHNTFMCMDGTKKATNIDINKYPDKFWEFLKITPSMCPEKLWKSNLSNGEITELTFWRLHANQHDKRNPSALVEYNGSDGEIYGIKLVINNNLLQYSGYDGFESGLHYIDVRTNGMHTSKLNAEKRIKYFVLDELDKQSKRKHKKKPLKTMALATEIIERMPEIFV